MKKLRQIYNSFEENSFQWKIHTKSMSTIIKVSNVSINTRLNNQQNEVIQYVPVKWLQKQPRVWY